MMERVNQQRDNGSGERLKQAYSHRTAVLCRRLRNTAALLSPSIHGCLITTT